MARVFIAGCGDLGAGLASVLVAQGHQVVGLRRVGVVFPEGVVGMTGDLKNIPVKTLPEADIVYLIMTPNDRSASGYEEAYYLTAQRLIDAYQHKEKPPKIFFVSSTSVYGQTSVSLLNEQDEAIPSSDTAKILLATEHLLNEAMAATSIRFSGIYGPKRYRLIQSVVDKKELGDNQWSNRIHRQDCVRLLAFLMKLHLAGRALDCVYIGTDSTPVSQWEVKLWIAAELGISLGSCEPLDLKAYRPISGKRLSNQKIRELGFDFIYPSYTLGYQSLVEEYLQSYSHHH